MYECIYKADLVAKNNNSNQCGRRAHQKLGFFILTKCRNLEATKSSLDTILYKVWVSVSRLPMFLSSLILSSSWLLTECCQAPKQSWTLAGQLLLLPNLTRSHHRSIATSFHRRSHPHRSLNPRQCVIMDPIPSFPGSSFHPSLETLKLLRNKIIIFVLIL